MTDIRNVSGLTDDNQDKILKKLKDLVPAAFLDGSLDVEQLLLSLGLKSQTEASFSFSWPGIEKARTDARVSTSATLIPDERASLNWGEAKDTLIEGDNLQVLKLLKSAYRASAKLIYIDPPYNTGNTFTYNDNYSVSESEYLKQTSQVDEHGNVLTSKVESKGRKHAPWLTMMFSRLVVARHLLRRDGVFMASIDNNEVHHLRLLLDAVFGADNFVDMFTWRGARKGDAKLTGGGQDYILVYARDREWLRANDVRWRERKEGLEAIYSKVEELRQEYINDYDEITKQLRKWYKSLSDNDPSKEHDHYNQVDERGIWFSDNISSPNYRENLVFTWKGYSPPENGWRYDKAKMEMLDADNRLIYPEDKSKRIKIKAYLHMREYWAPPSVFYKDRRAASKSLKDLMEQKVFDDPKSVDVLARLIQSVTDDGDLVIDFFAGSGSTGQAVWEQNFRDKKTRNWVLVQLPEQPDSSEDSGKNAIKEGYNNIFEITIERLRRAAKSLEDKEVGFRVFRTRPTNLVIESPLIAEEEMTGQAYIEKSIINSKQCPIIKGRDDSYVAWELLLKSTNFKLDCTLKTHMIDQVKVFEFSPPEEEDNRRLFISLDEFTIETADQLGLEMDDTLILRGDIVDDSTTLTLAPKMQKNLILLERVPREVSL